MTAEEVAEKVREREKWASWFELSHEDSTTLIESYAAEKVRAALREAADRAIAWSQEKYPEGTEKLTYSELSMYIANGLRAAILGGFKEVDENKITDDEKYRKLFDAGELALEQLEQCASMFRDDEDFVEALQALRNAIRKE
jgi:hypothetical protein